MTIAVISDVHGNLEALTAVFKYLKEKSISEIYCLGDIVGYGPNPNECIELISNKCKKIVLGNHDHAALGLTSTEYFNDFAKMSTYWTSNNLSKESKDFLLSLELRYETEKYIMVHSTPSDPIKWHYILSELDAQNEFFFFNQKVCFIGHSHFPIIFYDSGYVRDTKVKLEKKRKYIINVGSVGQPRDRNPKTCFCLYNIAREEIEYIRLDYDVNATRDKILKAGLPIFLADRLIRGY